MNYAKLYSQLVSKPAAAVGFTEVHHIVPRCLGGSDAPENLVRLSARAHFLAHWLLHKMHPESGPLAQAFSVMRFGAKHCGRTFTARGFEAARRAHIKAMRERMKSWNPMKGEEARQKVSESKLGITLSPDVRRKISEAKTGIARGPHSQQTRSRQSGVEFHNPVSGVTVRFKVHLGETPPDGWVRGRALSVHRIWVTDGASNLKIAASSDLPPGFQRGRSLRRDAGGKVIKCQS